MTFSDIDEGFFWPFCEPIDGGAVDEGREHSKSGGKLIGKRTHDNDHMYISFDPDKILGEDIDLGGRDIFTGTFTFTIGCNILHIFFLIDSCDISRIENIIYIFKHLFVYELSITEKETYRFVL